MKKLWAIFGIFAIVLGCGILTACGSNGDKGKEFALSYSPDGTLLTTFESDEENTNKAEKKVAYKLSCQYGNFKASNVYLTWGNSGDALVIEQKTDSEDGYTILSGLVPAEGVNLAVGDYTIVYAYKGWTATLSIKIEKRLVYEPSLRELYYTWTGEEITMNFENYDPEWIDADESKFTNTEVGYYSVIFSLKDKENTCWFDSQNGTNDVKRDWQIEQKKVDVSNIVANDLLHVEYDGLEHSLEIGDYDTSKLMVYYEKNEQKITSAPVSAGGYSLFAEVIDKEHYTIGDVSNNFKEQIGYLSIYQKGIDVPEETQSTTFNGTDIDVLQFLFGADAGIFEVEAGNAVITEAGTYIINIRIKNSNYVWKDHPQNRVTVTLSVNESEA